MLSPIFLPSRSLGWQTPDIILRNHQTTNPHSFGLATYPDFFRQLNVTTRFYGDNKNSGHIIMLENLGKISLPNFLGYDLTFSSFYVPNVQAQSY